MERDASGDEDGECASGVSEADRVAERQCSDCVLVVRRKCDERFGCYGGSGFSGLPLLADGSIMWTSGHQFLRHNDFQRVVSDTNGIDII